MSDDKKEYFKEVENILNSIDNLDEKVLKKVLANIIKIYIMDKGLSYEGNINDNTGKNKAVLSNNVNISNFYEFILHAKKNYPFQELENFLLENGEVYILMNDKKNLLSKGSKEVYGRIIDDELTSVKQKEDDSQKNKISPERFKNLEMDK